MKKSEKAKVNSKDKAHKLAQQSPEGEIVDDSADTSKLYSISEVAKQLGFEEEVFIDLLIEKGVLYREGEGMPLLPYPEWVEKGYLAVVPVDAE